MDYNNVLRLEVEVPSEGLKNLVQNHSGEFGTWFWESPVNNTILEIDGIWKTLKFRTTVAQAAYWRSEAMPVSPGQYVSMRFGAVAASTGVNVKVRFEFYDSSRTLISSSAQSAAFAGDFTTQYYNGPQAPAGSAFMRVRFDMYNGTGNPLAGDAFVFDKVMVVRASSPSEFGTTRTNLVANGNFETATLPWTITAGPYSANPGREADAGRTGQALVVMAPGNQTGQVISYAYDLKAETSRWTITPGKDYTASAYVRLRTLHKSAKKARLEITYRDSAGTVLGQSVSDSVPLTTSYVRLSTTQTAPSAATSASVSVVFSPNPGYHYTFDAFFVDDVMLEQSMTVNPFFIGTTVDSNYPFTEPYDWRNILGPTRHIEVTRKDLDVGLLSADIKDALLDPAVSDTIRPGKKVRLRALVGTEWESVYEGTITSATVKYDKKKQAGAKVQTNININASDAVATLANHGESRGVATMADLPHILEGKGVPWSINGSGNQVVSANVVSYNENASTLDQIAVTRDSNMGIAYVNRNNVLVGYDRSVYYDTPASYYEFADTLTFDWEVSYSDIDVDFDLDRCINSVEIKWLRYNVGTGTTEEISYGPYINQESIDTWGPRSATFTIQGPTESASLIADYARMVLEANATPIVKVNSLKMPVRNEKELEAAVTLDLFDAPMVTYGDKVSRLHIISGIKHTIEPDKWSVEYEFGVAGSVASPTYVPSPPFTGVDYDTGWKPFAFASGYSQGAAGEVYVAEYRRVGKQVFMRGLVKPNSGTFAAGTAVTVGSLPADMRPSRYQWTSLVTNSASISGRLYITTSGVVVHPSAACVYAALDHTWLVD